MASVKKIPEGMHSITAQLSLDGAAEAIDFYRKAFGAEELDRAPDPSGKKIWHAMLRIGDSRFFVNDVFPEMGGKAGHATLWLYADDVDALYKRAVSTGGKGVTPPTDMFWGDRTAQVDDKWGNSWHLATHVKDVTPEEMKKAGEEFAAKMAKSKK